MWGSDIAVEVGSPQDRHCGLHIVGLQRLFQDVDGLPHQSTQPFLCRLPYVLTPPVEFSHEVGVLIPPSADGLSGNPYLLGNSLVSVPKISKSIALCCSIESMG